MRRLYISVVALALTNAPVLAQSPTGYHRTPVVALPEFINDSLAGGRFTLLIDRRTSSAEEKQALEIAESTVPDAAEIERDAALEKLSAVSERLGRAALMPGERWWWDSFDDVLTPYAVTGASVTYYANRIRERAAQPNPFTQFSEGRPHNGSFQYRAHVTTLSPEANGGAAFLVHLELSWRYWCGMLCAVSFGKGRDVMISSDGRVIQIRGDGKPMLAVS